MDLSFWELDTYFDRIDITIVGAGIVGLNTALCLKKKHPKLKILVLERGLLPMGASSKNAGFACFGSPSELLMDLKKHSESEIFGLVEKRWKGLQRLRKNLGDKAIDFHNWGGYEVFDSEKEFDECEEKLEYLNKQSAPIINVKKVYRTADKKIKTFGLGNIKHIIENIAEGQIDTGKMISRLTMLVQQMGVMVINNIEVNSFTDAGNKVSVSINNTFNFNTRRLIITTNGFAKQLLPEYPVTPARAQVLITAPIKNLKLKGAFHYKQGYYYFRNINNRVLFGGGRNLDIKGEATTEFGTTKQIQDHLDELLRTIILPGNKYSIEHRWSGIMGLGPQKITITKAVSKNVFCAVRMGGMGIAIGSLVGEEAAQLVNRSL
jgi:gamma-glutamylputrescine oxidase